MSTQKITLYSLVLMLGLALAGFLFHVQTQPLHLAPQQSIDLTGQPVLGQAKAPIDIVLFEDLKCFNCMRFNLTVFPALKRRYIDTGIARYHVITLGFLPGSLPAANAALCAYAQHPDFFFKFIDRVYHNQPPENEDWATTAKLMGFARQVKGLNLDQLSTCAYQSTYAPVIQKNFKIALSLMGEAMGTPALYINGHRAPKTDIETLSQIIRQLQRRGHE